MFVKRSQSFVGTLGLSEQRVVAQAFWITTFAALTAIAAQIEIPTRPVPITLQTMVVLLSGAFLGKRNGSISMLLYLMLGLVGLPVFSGFGFGLAKLVGPTGGYLLAFPAASYLIGTLSGLSSKRSIVFLSMTAGLILIFAIGVVQLNLVYFHDWKASIQSGLLMFSIWDPIKLLAASAIYSQYLGKSKA
jgi:biotin transport system substrate-specific component